MNKKTRSTLLYIILPAILLCLCARARASMILQGLTGPVTGTEISSFTTFMQGQPPTTNQTYDNTLADGTAGMNAEALGQMYEVSNDPTILDMMINYSDAIIALRNDFTDRRVMWDGNVDPVWLTKAATDPAAGYAGCENNDIVGHVAYCAQLIIETPSLWNTTVPDGNPHGYGVTYYQRATNYIAQMEVVQDNYMIQYFIDPGTHRITAPTSSAWTSLNENTTAWNRQMMFMNGFQRLSECHQLLGDNPAKVALYDSIVAAAVNWFFTGLSLGSASGHPTYDWSYCPTCTGPEDNTLHSTYDIWGTTRAYASGRYGISNATLVPFANTLRYVMNIATNEISTYVDGTGASRNFIYPGWMPICEFDPCTFAIMANMDSSRQSGTPIYDAMILWVKNARYLGVYPSTCEGADFSLGTPWFETMAAGGGTNCQVRVNPLSGFNGTVVLGISGLPAGVTGSFNPSTISGGSGVSTLTLTASGSAVVGTCGLMNAAVITGSSGGETRTATVTLVITPGTAGFTVTATPSSQPVTVGSGTSYTVNVGSVGGFSGNVSLGVTGLPSGASGAFNPTSVAAPGSSTLNVSTAVSTPAGNDTLDITGTSGSLMNSTTVTLGVNDFTISTTPASQTVAAGNSTNYTVTIGNDNGFTGTVDLTAGGLPSGATASFNPTSVNSLGTSTLTVSTTTSTPTGTNALTVTGTSGSLAHSNTVAFDVVPPPDFTISATPSSQTVIAGNNTTYTVNIGAVSGFSGSVALTASGLPSGATANYNPASVTGSGASTLTITTSASTPTGTSTLTLTGTSGSLVHTTTVSLVVNPVPDFSISATPSSQTVIAGNNTTYTVNIGAINGFSGSVSLTASGLPSGATANYNPTSVSGSGASTLTITTSTSTPAGTDTLTLTGTSGSLVHTTTVSLVVNSAPDFSISGTPSSQTVTAGNNTTYTVNIGALNGFSGSVALTATGLPTGATATYNPTSVTGSGSSTLTITTANSTPAGTNTLTLKGTSGSLVHSTTVALVVNGAPSFSISATPSSQTVTQGSNTTYTVTIGALNGFSGSVALTASGLPSSATATYNPTSVTGSGSSTLTVATTTNTPAGTNTLTLKGTSGTLTNTTTITLVVVQSQFSGIYEIQNVTSSQVLNQGGSLTNGSPISQWREESSPNLEFTFIATSNGYYQINSVKSGLDVVVANAATTNNAPLVQWSFGSSGDDQWKPVQNTNGTWTFYNLHSGLTLNNSGGSTTEGTQYSQWSWANSPNEEFNLIPQ
jgi:hypothetical protein